MPGSAWALGRGVLRMEAVRGTVGREGPQRGRRQQMSIFTSRWRQSSVSCPELLVQVLSQ